VPVITLNCCFPPVKIDQLEADLKAAKDAGGGAGIFQKMPLPVAMAVTSSEVISSLNEHLVVTLQVCDRTLLTTKVSST